MTKSFSLLSSWLIIAVFFICLSANGVQITNQQQNRIHQKQKINQKQKLDTKSKIETKVQAASQVDQRTEEDMASDVFVEAEGNIIKNSNVDDQAMYAYSKAMLNGENVMELPDKPKEKEPEISDEVAMQLFQEQQDKKQAIIIDQQIEEEKPKLSEDDQSKILEFNDAIEKIVEKPKPPPTQEFQDSQAAIDAVNIVIPEGMEVKTHRQNYENENAQTDDNGDQQELLITKEENKKLETDSNEAQDQSQAALDFIAVQDPDKLKPKQKENKAPQMEHLFDAPDVVPAPKKEEPYVASKLLDSENQAQLNSNAATEDVKVKQVDDTNANKKDKEPLMPQSLAPKKKHQKSESEIERSIRMAEKSQDGDEEEQENQEEQVDAQIAGSDNVWEGSIEMGAITEKLTRSKDYKTPAQLKQLQKIAEKKEKERITNELLAQTPISTDDMKEYAGNLAQQSVNSKSDLEIEEETAAKQKEQQKKQDLQNKAIQEKKQAAQAKKQKEQQEEQNLIKQGQMARMQKKNDKDQQSLEDLQALEKLQRSGSLTQIDGLAEQAAIEEKDRAESQKVEDGAQAIRDEADKEEQEIEKESQSSSSEAAPSAPDFSNLRKVKELSQKLGVKAQPGDANLGSKEKIAEAMVQRAIQAGKTQAEIKKAMS